MRVFEGDPHQRQTPFASSRISQDCARWRFGGEARVAPTDGSLLSIGVESVYSASQSTCSVPYPPSNHLGILHQSSLSHGIWTVANKHDASHPHRLPLLIRPDLSYTTKALSLLQASSYLSVSVCTLSHACIATCSQVTKVLGMVVPKMTSLIFRLPTSLLVALFPPSLSLESQSLCLFCFFLSHPCWSFRYPGERTELYYSR